MVQKHKLKSALELAKYRPGDTLYWIISHPLGREPIIDENDAWLFTDSVHPKTPYKYGILKGVWTYRDRLPKLHASDFSLVLELITSEFIIEEFKIEQVVRCQQTGEFVYRNTTGEEWMPESLLFDSKAAAKKERERIKKLIVKWAARTQQDPI